MEVYIARRSCFLGGASILVLFVLLQSALAFDFPANFVIGKAEVYKPSPQNTKALPIHISDILNVDIHWSIFNAKWGEYIRVGIDPALQVIPLKTFYLMGTGEHDKPKIQVAKCSKSQSNVGLITCILNVASQRTLDEYGTLTGILRLETTLNVKKIGDHSHRVFEFQNANFEQTGAFSAEIPIARAEDYKLVAIPKIEIQRTCSWKAPADGDKADHFACTIIFPIGFQLSRLIVSDKILRGEATPVSAYFTQEDVNDAKKKQHLVSYTWYRSFYRRSFYELQMRDQEKGETLDGSTFRFRLDIVYQSHHSYADDAEGFVGIAKIKSDNYEFERMSYLPPFSAWKRIFPNAFEDDPEKNLLMSNQNSRIPSEQLPVPAALVLETSHALPTSILLTSVDQNTQTNQSFPMDLSNANLQSISVMKSQSSLKTQVDIPILLTSKSKLTMDQRNGSQPSSVAQFTKHTLAMKTVMGNEPTQSLSAVVKHAFAPGFPILDKDVDQHQLHSSEKLKISETKPLAGAAGKVITPSIDQSIMHKDHVDMVRNSDHYFRSFIYPTISQFTVHNQSSGIAKTYYSQRISKELTPTSLALRIDLASSLTKLSLSWTSSSLITTKPPILRASPSPLSLANTAHFEAWPELFPPPQEKSASESELQSLYWYSHSDASIDTGSDVSEISNAVFSTMTNDDNFGNPKKSGKSYCTATRSIRATVNKKLLDTTDFDGRLSDENEIITISESKHRRQSNGRYSTMAIVHVSQNCPTCKVKPEDLSNRPNAGSTSTVTAPEGSEAKGKANGRKPSSTVQQHLAQTSEGLEFALHTSQRFPWMKQKASASSPAVSKHGMASSSSHNDAHPMFSAIQRRPYSCVSAKEALRIKGFSCTTTPVVELNAITSPNVAFSKVDDRNRIATTIDGVLKSDIDCVEGRAFRHGNLGIFHKYRMNSTACALNASISSIVDIRRLDAQIDLSTAILRSFVEPKNFATIRETLRATAVYENSPNEPDWVATRVGRTEPQQRGRIHLATYASHTRNQDTNTLPKPTSKVPGKQYSVANRVIPATWEALMPVLTFIFFY